MVRQHEEFQPEPVEEMEGLSPEELAAQEAEELPDRQVMSVVEGPLPIIPVHGISTIMTPDTTSPSS